MVAALVLIVWCGMVCVQGGIMADLGRCEDICAGLMMKGRSSMYSWNIIKVWADLIANLCWMGFLKGDGY